MATMVKRGQEARGGGQGVLSLLKRRGQATAKEIAGALGVTGMAVRKHLSVLSAAGLVTYETEHRPRGRPVRVYRLTREGHEVFPKNYDRLALAVLEEVARQEGPKRLTSLVRAYHKHLRQQAQERLQGLDFSRRVQEVAALLDENGHMAEFRPHPEGYVILEHNCTISRVSQRFPECCQAELALLRDLLKAPVERLNDQADGDPYCAYLVRRPTEK